MTDPPNDSLLTDDELMIRIQLGETAAYVTLVERYQGMLIGFFLRNTHDLQLSEDLTQETLLKVYHQAWDYLPLGRFRGWMFRIARNLLIDDVRRRSHDALVRAVSRRHGEDDDILSGIAGELVPAERQVELSEFSKIIDTALAEIPDDQRQTFLLHHFSGMGLQEVAEVMEVPLATCKSRLRLARQKLAEKLQTRGLAPPVPTGAEIP